MGTHENQAIGWHPESQARRHGKGTTTVGQRRRHAGSDAIGSHRRGKSNSSRRGLCIKNGSCQGRYRTSGIGNEKGNGKRNSRGSTRTRESSTIGTIGSISNNQGGGGDRSTTTTTKSISS